MDDRLRAALDLPAEASSDFDLNPALAPDNPARKLRPAAVLIAVDDAGGVVLTKRASHLRHHPGQIAFPGGRQDAGDPDLAATAMREAREEIGLDPAQVRILGTLPTHETVTGFLVTPFVARLDGSFTPRPEPGEVAEVFRVPLAHVTDPARFVIERRIWRGQWRHFYAIPWGPYYTWGASARILRGLADRMAQCK
ncbi:putative Nudix hydrolase NudL [Roseibaca ekhonensis]|uniref:Putative Nudix hydrolase NudL n=1 Tax=Roseinatronobacter ekhonensis TaxID=254356 RepID=A0A3B0M6V9_9RHOB|nr:CoA pyrophosphatase [Roseibaca ekhonensis]SUZ31735.1 putative Nudix hydrolase NudL [Roseibaca ekhonensis]